MLRDTKPTEVVLNGQAADNKRVAAVYRCRLEPDQLKATDHPDIKFCEKCSQKVFKVIDFDGFEKAVASRGCVWGPNDIRPTGEPSRDDFFFGVPALPPYIVDRSGLKWDE